MNLTDRDIRSAENAGAMFGLAFSALPPSNLHGSRKCRDLSGTNPALVLAERVLLLFRYDIKKARYKEIGTIKGNQKQGGRILLHANSALLPSLAVVEVFKGSATK